MALSRVMASVNPELSEQHRTNAYDHAYAAGANAAELTPYFDGEPLLLKGHRDGAEEQRLFEAHKAEQEAIRIRTYDCKSLIKEAQDRASKGCGQSYELYEKRLQAAYAFILTNAPQVHRAATEAALMANGYEPDFEPYQSKPGECSLTGIDEHCCPCGRHE